MSFDSVANLSCGPAATVLNCLRRLAVGATLGLIFSLALLAQEAIPPLSGRTETPRRIVPGQKLLAEAEGQWVEAEGEVTFLSERGEGWVLELSSSTSRMRVEVTAGGGVSPSGLLHSRLRASGVVRVMRTLEGEHVAGTVVTPDARHLTVLEAAAPNRVPQPANRSRSLPQLTRIEEVKRLSREEAQRAYPVRIRGVVTAVLETGFLVQDATWAGFVLWPSAPTGERPRVGEYWDIEGVTFADFAPSIQPSRIERLGTGTLPEPLHPTWDQLINGSLDACYVEVQGIVTGAHTNDMELLTRSGKIKIQLVEAPSRPLKRYEHALVRVRGCVIPGRDFVTKQVRPGRLELSNWLLNVDEPAPVDPFAVRPVRVSELLLFNWRASALEPVRVAGQVVHGRGGEYYLMEGASGLRFVPQGPVALGVGDLVEVVGFPDLSGPSPVMREAVARRTGQGALPPARPLPADALLSREHDATLVQVEARVVNVSFNRADQVLELQAGNRGFFARLDSRQGGRRDLVPGSLLKLEGVYAGQGGNRASGREIDSFELLLNSPAAVVVLERPSWWTLQHTLVVVGGLTLVLVAALVWITLLRRQVEERSQQLAAEIRLHEQTEHKRALEAERARIAHDLHDDLGATLTQIRFLSALESRDQHVPAGTRSRMSQVTEKAREMVASLDEIVWAVNPEHDSFASLAAYLCQVAEEFFLTSPIRCRLDIADPLPALALTSEVRHHIYLIVKEAFNNVAKHSGATEAWLRVHWKQPVLHIVIEDNGRGFSLAAAATVGEGLTSLRQRAEKIGGQFECESRPGAGTRYRLRLPLKLC